MGRRPESAQLEPLLAKSSLTRGFRIARNQRSFGTQLTPQDNPEPRDAMMRTRSVWQVAVMAAVAVHALPAQGPAPLASRLALEGSVQYQRFSDDLASQTGPGVGYEGQVRYFSNGWSIGVGVDYVQHEKQYVTLVGAPPAVVTRPSDANFTGLFVEPRLPLGGPGARSGRTSSCEPGSAARRPR